MHTFLITYGADSLMATFEADSPAHAVEQFVSWAPVSHDPEENEKAITGVDVLCPVKPSDDGTGYAHCPGDGSFFGLKDLAITFVPAEVHNDADEIKDYLSNIGDEI